MAVKRVNGEAVDRDEVWFAIYRDLREELRAMPGIPRDYNPVAELARLGLSGKGGPALTFLCHKTAADFMFPRMTAGEPPALPGMKGPRRIEDNRVPALIGDAATEEWLGRGKKRA